MLILQKNILINGNKYYSQRKPTGTVTPTTAYQYLTNDRFAQKIAGTITTPTVEAANDFPIAKSPWCSKFTGIMASGSSILEQQRVEADFGLHLIGEYVSFLTYVTSTSCSKLTVNIGYATAKDNHASQVLLTSKEFTLKTDGSVNEIIWEKISQLSSLISTGLYVELVLSNPTNTSTSSVHRFGGATLLRSRYSPVETLLASRSLIDELRYCQRYYEKSWNHNVAVGTANNEYVRNSIGILGWGANNYFAHEYKIVKRVPAAVSIYDMSGVINYITVYKSATGYSVPLYSLETTTTCRFSGYAQGTPTDGSCNFFFTASSEL